MKLRRCACCAPIRSSHHGQDMAPPTYCQLVSTHHATGIRKCPPFWHGTARAPRGKEDGKERRSGKKEVKDMGQAGTLGYGCLLVSSFRGLLRNKHHRSKKIVCAAGRLPESGPGSQTGPGWLVLGDSVKFLAFTIPCASIRLALLRPSRFWIQKTKPRQREKKRMARNQASAV